MSLRDEMLKAGLITEDQAKQSAHKQRTDNKRTDRKERQQSQQAKQAEVRSQQDAERARHKEQAGEQLAKEAERQQTLQVQQRRGSGLEAAYRDGAMPNWEGGRRYYYAAHGRVELLMVTEDVSRKLEAGQAAICAGERNPNRHLPLNLGGARKLQELAPERVLVLHGPQ